MPVNGFDVFDGDGHVLEDSNELIRYYEGDYAGRTQVTALGLFPGLDGVVGLEGQLLSHL